MHAPRTYLDYNATAPLRATAFEAMVAALGEVGNPSSIHAEGRRGRALVENARQAVASLVGSSAEGVVFTSGGTEADGLMLAGWDGPVAISAVEHDAVRAVRADATVLPVDGDGVLEIDGLAGLQPGTLVSVMTANNETGVVQPIAAIADEVRARGCILHCDAVQTIGRLSPSPLALGADAATVSAHKMGGPKGIGALVVRDPSLLPAPIIRGGGQERNRRAGTENVAAIAGFGAVAREAAGLAEAWRDVAVLRDWIEGRLATISPHVVIAGRDAERLPNTSCVSLAGADAHTLVIAFDLAGFALSAGAACSSGKVARSRVLQAMGWDDAQSGGAIRVSLGLETAREEAERFVAAWTTIAPRYVVTDARAA